MDERFLISYDLGTSGVKSILISTSHRVLASVTRNYPLYTNAQNYAEQDPDDYWRAICEGTRALLAQTGLTPEQCVGLSIGTIWKSVIPLDKDGKQLRRSIIWMDKRATKQAAMLNRRFGEDCFNGQDYWPKLAWFRENEPELYEQTAYILEPGTYLNWKATGVMVSDNTRCYTRSFFPEMQDFYSRILACIDVDPAKFPPLCASSDQVGTLTPQAALEMGLAPGIPVFSGCCDIPATALGSGCTAPGSVHVYLGTSGYMPVVEPYNHKAELRLALDRENVLQVYGFCASVGAVTNRVIDMLYPEARKTWGKDIWTFLNKELETIPAGSDRLMVAPWMFGSHAPLASENARGLLVNLRENHTRAHILNAVLESFCYIVRQNKETLEQDYGRTLDQLTICGGGATNPHWMQAMANVLKIDILVPKNAADAGAMGVARSIFSALGQEAEHAEIERVYHPDLSTFAEYDLIYGQYKTLYSALSGVFDTLNG